MEEEKAKYKADNATQLEKFEKACEVMNRSKKSDGTLPKATDLNLEIERHEKLKEQITEKNLLSKSKLNKYKTIEENLEIILADKNIIKTTEEKLQTKKENCL